MGWTGIYQDVPDPVEFLKKELTWVGEDGFGCRVLAASRVGNTVYMAMERSAADVKPYVFAMVVLTERKRGGRDTQSEFLYKEMDESMQPYAVDCPCYIMNMLTPLEEMPGGPHTYAAEWRKQVAEHRTQKRQQNSAARRLRVGMCIELPQPVTFTGYGKFSKFKVVRADGNGKVVFVPVDGSFSCRLRRATLATAVVVQENK